MTVIYLLTGKQAQQLETDSQTGEIVWRQYASHVSPIMAIVIDRAIARLISDRYPTVRVMLDTLQSIANPIPPTQPLLTQPTVVSAPPPQTVPVKPQPNPQSNSQNNILIGSLIAGGLIGASVIISQVLPIPFFVIKPFHKIFDIYITVLLCINYFFKPLSLAKRGEYLHASNTG